MDYATGLGHQRSTASPALSARRPATVFLEDRDYRGAARDATGIAGGNAQAPAEPTVHTWRMVTFRREIRLWHETGATQRALMIRDDADTCWLACQMQHSRITTPGPVVINDPRSATIQRRIDADPFVVSLNRLQAVARLAAEVADPRNVLPAALDQFSDQTAGLEHPGFGGDSILPRCSGLGGRCLPRYRRLAEPRSDHFSAFVLSNICPAALSSCPAWWRAPPARPPAGAGVSPRRAPAVRRGFPGRGQG